MKISDRRCSHSPLTSASKQAMGSPIIEKEPDAVLFGRHNEVIEWIEYFSVPIFGFRGLPSVETCAGHGTGVLLRIAGRGFIITAGHVVEDFRGMEFHVGIAKGKHFYSPTLVRQGYRHRGISDYGYFEVEAANVGKLAGRDKIWASLDRLHVRYASELLKEDDWLVLSGFPGSISSPTSEGTGVRLLTWNTTVPGYGPDHVPEQPDGAQAIGIAIPKKEQVSPLLGNWRDVEIPLLGGASGGGVWKANVRPSPESWSTNSMKLAAVHSRSSPRYTRANDGQEYRHSNEVLVGHHLRLIADDFEDLRQEIFSRWPILTDDCWAP